MGRFHSYVNTASGLLRHYEGQLPLGIYLKQWFSREKKYGGRDRRSISQLCYQYFRLGNQRKKWSLEEGIVAAALAAPQPDSGLLAEVRPEWLSVVDLAQAERLAFLGVNPSAIFPEGLAISAGIDAKAYSASMLHQPGLFLRIRPGCREKVLKIMHSRGEPYEIFGQHCIKLPNGTKVSEWLPINQWAVVQDASSQQTGELLQPWLEAKTANFQVWDCCAASGGKSILLHDLFGPFKLTVSDIRPSILSNLRQRFKEAGIQTAGAQVADLTLELPHEFAQKFDLVVADVPCSGSGTWARTPEQMAFWKPENVADFSRRQLQIASHAWQAVKPGGLLVYITCSVFRAENEAVVNQLKEESGAHELLNKTINGTGMGADCMYIAVLRKP